MESTLKETGVEEACVKPEPLFIKVEATLDESYRDDPLSDSGSASVKVEQSSPGAGTSASGLSDHAVKIEVVQPPQPRRSIGTIRGQVLPRYQCGNCRYSTTNEAYLETHRRKHNKHNSLECDNCGYTCSNKALLRNHMRKHFKPFKCSKCSYAAGLKSDLRHHELKHTGEKPYKCGHCSYATTQRYTLTIHERTHTGEKPFKCDQCSYACARKTNFLMHKSKHTSKQE